MKKEKSETVVNDALTALLNSAIMLKNATRQFFRDKKITEAQFNILRLLKSADHPLTQKELSEQLLVDKSNLTGLVDRMESAGHLRRNKTEKDRRSYHLELTPAAEALLEELERPYRELLNSMMGDFSVEELLQIVRLMNKLQRSLDDRCACTAAGLPDDK